MKNLRPSRTKAQAQPGDYAHMFRFLEKKIFNTGVKSLSKVEKLASTAGALPKDKAISAWQTYEYCTDWYTAGVNNGEIDWSTLHSSGYSTCYTETVWVDDDNPYTPPYGASDPPPFSGGGGTGYSSTSNEGLEAATVVDDGKPKIRDIKKYLDCFADGKVARSYTMTIFVDQPNSGSDDWFNLVFPQLGVTQQFNCPTGIVWRTAQGNYFDVGHTFVTFEKNNSDGTNVRQTLGFYPSANAVSSTGAMEDNSGHSADIRYTMNVTEEQFKAGLQKVESDFDTKKYILANYAGDEYNCTDAAISWMNAAGANFGNSSSGLFKNTPGTFGEVLRNMPGAYTNPTSGIAGKDPCN